MSTKNRWSKGLFIGAYLGAVDIDAEVGVEIYGAYLGAKIYGAEVRATSVPP
jgi:hypothetical protein